MRDVSSWSYRSPRTDSRSAVRRRASRGDHALEFLVGASRGVERLEGLVETLAFERPEATDAFSA